MPSGSKGPLEAVGATSGHWPKLLRVHLCQSCCLQLRVSRFRVVGGARPLVPQWGFRPEGTMRPGVWHTTTKLAF